MNFVHFVERAYRKFVKLTSHLQSPLLLLLRVYFGYQLYQSGKGHLSNMDDFVKVFEKLNIPMPSFNAHFVGWFECIGGILLALGALTRVVALGFVVNMMVAYYTADNAALRAFWSDSDKFEKADPFPYLYTALVVSAFGAGVFSVDWLIGWLWRKKQHGAS